MADDARLYRFEMQYTDWDQDPYYVRWWDKAKPITVVAENQALGDAPRGRVWAARVVSITDHRIPEVSR